MFTLKKFFRLFHKVRNIFLLFCGWKKIWNHTSESIAIIFWEKNTRTFCQSSVAVPDPGWKNPDAGWKNPDPESGIEKSRSGIRNGKIQIRAKYPGSAILRVRVPNFFFRNTSSLL
jgi:hypothetical protein